MGWQVSFAISQLWISSLYVLPSALIAGHLIKALYINRCSYLLFVNRFFFTLIMGFFMSTFVWCKCSLYNRITMIFFKLISLMVTFRCRNLKIQFLMLCRKITLPFSNTKVYIIYLYKSSVIFISCFLITWYFILLGSVLQKEEIFSNTWCLISLSAPEERQDPCAQSVCKYPIMGTLQWTAPLDWRLVQVSFSESLTK